MRYTHSDRPIDPSSGAARHLLPQGEKENALSLVQETGCRRVGGSTASKVNEETQPIVINGCDGSLCCAQDKLPLPMEIGTT
jgi:hypothetical protein